MIRHKFVNLRQDAAEQADNPFPEEQRRDVRSIARGGLSCPFRDTHTRACAFTHASRTRVRLLHLTAIRSSLCRDFHTDETRTLCRFGSQTDIRLLITLGTFLSLSLSVALFHVSFSFRGGHVCFRAMSYIDYTID